jgi:5'-methylthioadenosine phosphorylase
VRNRANIAALRFLGVRCIIAFSAVGSLQEEIKPRDFVVPDQVIDRTKGIRPFTFFEGGVVGHVGFADPFDEEVAKIVRRCGHALEGEGVVMHDKGTVICMGRCSLSSPNQIILWCHWFEIGKAANAVLQKDHNSLPAQNPTCTALGVVP